MPSSQLTCYYPTSIIIKHTNIIQLNQNNNIIFTNHLLKIYNFLSVFLFNQYFIIRIWQSIFYYSSRFQKFGFTFRFTTTLKCNNYLKSCFFRLVLSNFNIFYQNLVHRIQFLRLFFLSNSSFYTNEQHFTKNYPMSVSYSLLFNYTWFQLFFDYIQYCYCFSPQIDFF